VKIVSCHYCGGDFEATRSDATRCSNCRKQYLVEYRKRPEVRQRRKEAHRKVREAAFAGYGSCCECCGEDNFEFLAIDHVDGGGRKERETMSTYQIAKKVICLEFPEEYRVLCHNCNQSMGWYGYCPHKRTA
tara:strand:+ start:486 stop:881 length:396 start_codon:yes stop_codon:yes gene_type:complete